MASWDRKMHTELARRENAAGKHQADSATIEATKTLESLKNILAHTLGVAFLQRQRKTNERIDELEKAYAEASFESVCYQICLRTLHELLEADQHDHIEKILFNGFVTAIDRRTGQEARSCLMSVLVDRGTFLGIDLSRVDPRICFKSLKGVSGASLSALAPIAPVMELNREDRRFVDGREIGDSLDEATNLAEMDWEDFEHLVRDLFEKEFAARGGEVRVTRSSKDGGGGRCSCIRSRSNQWRQDRDPGEALHEDSRCRCGSRSLWNDGKRRSEQGYLGDDSRLWTRCVQVCIWQAYYPDDRSQSSAPACTARYEGQD